VAIAAQIIELFDQKGSALYYGEAVTERDHALQCAALARAARVADDVVLAALLHDIGHLLHGLPEDVAAKGIDGQHEDAGAAWLAPHFPRAVVDPVRLHVAAKRYLCAVEPDYALGLSAASLRSLELQGGAMSPAEVRDFEMEPHAHAAIAVRRWDDGAKVPDLQVPPIESYRSLLEAAHS